MASKPLLNDSTLLLLLGVSLAWGGVVVIALAVSVIGRWLTHKYSQRDLRADEPRCRRCRYIVKGITSTSCPECGASLTHGVLLPTPRKPFPAIVLAIYLTLLLAPGPLLFGFYTLGKLMPWCNHAQWSTAATFKGANDAWRGSTIHLNAVGTGNAFHFRVDAIWLIMSAAEGVRVTRGFSKHGVISWPDRLCNFQPSDGSQSETRQPLTRELLIQFLADLDPKPVGYQAEAVVDEVQMLIDAAAEGRKPSQGLLSHMDLHGETLQTTLDPPLPYFLLYLVGSLFVMIITTRFLARRIEAHRAKVETLPLT